MYQMFCHSEGKPSRSKRNARRNAGRLKLRAYYCSHCKGYHLTSKEIKSK